MLQLRIIAEFNGFSTNFEKIKIEFITYQKPSCSGLRNFIITGSKITASIISEITEE